MSNKFISCGSGAKGSIEVYLRGGRLVDLYYKLVRTGKTLERFKGKSDHI